MHLPMQQTPMNPPRRWQLPPPQLQPSQPPHPPRPQPPQRPQPPPPQQQQQQPRQQQQQQQQQQQHCARAMPPLQQQPSSPATDPPLTMRMVPSSTARPVPSLVGPSRLEAAVAAVEALLSSTYATAATATSSSSTANANAARRPASATHAQAAAAAAPRANTFVPPPPATSRRPLLPPAPLRPGVAQPNKNARPSSAAADEATDGWRGRLSSPAVATTPSTPSPGSLADLAAGRGPAAAAVRPKVPPPKSSGLGAGVQQAQGLMWVTTQMLPCGGAAAPATAAATAAAAAAASAASAAASSAASAAAAATAAWAMARAAPPPLPQPRPDAPAAAAPRPAGAASGLLLLSGGAEGAAAPDAKRQKLAARTGAGRIPAAHPPGVQVPVPSLDGGGVLNRGLRRHLRAQEIEARPWLARDRRVAPASLPTSVGDGPVSMGSSAGIPPAVAAAPAAGPGPYQPRPQQSVYRGPLQHQVSLQEDAELRGLGQ